MRIPLFILPQKMSRRIATVFRGLGEKFALLFPSLKYDLALLHGDESEGEYFIEAMANAFAWAILVFLIVALVLAMQNKVGSEALAEGAAGTREFLNATRPLRPAVVPGISAFVLFLALFLYYPRVLVRKATETVDNDLVYALKDLLIQVSSGVSLFNALSSVSKAGYGRVSKDFGVVVQDISAGSPQEVALEKLAKRTESDYLKRTMWQLITVLRTGASLSGALTSIVVDLTEYQRRQIKRYTIELNLWILLYVLLAAAIPSLGITLMVVLSAFSGSGVRESTMLLLTGGCLVCELLLIEYVRVKRPNLQG